MGENTSAIKEYILNARKHYLHGDYTKSGAIIRDLKDRLNEVAKIVSDCFECEENVVYIALENNRRISDAAMLLSEGNEVDNQKWNEVMDDLLRLVDILEGLKIAYRVPLVLHLNTVYNTLWWGWSKPSILQQDKSLVDSFLHTAIHMCNRVLEDCNVMLLTSSHSENEDRLFSLMKELCRQLIHIDGCEAMQILENFILTIHILIGASPTEQMYLKCADILESALGLRYEIRESAIRTKQKCAADNLFKFGLLGDINSILQKCDVNAVIEVAVITCALCCILAKRTEMGIALLKLEIKSENMVLMYLRTFLLALAYYYTKQMEASSLYVKKLEPIPMDDEARTRYHLLHGAILMKRGLYVEGLNELLKANEKQQRKDLQAVTLFHIAEAYEILQLIHPQSTSDQMSASREKPSFYDVPREGHIDALKHLVDVLRSTQNNSSNEKWSCDLQFRILSLLYPKPEVNLTLALYLLADRLVHDGEIQAASGTYSELLAHQDLYSHKTLLRTLPHVSVLHHNAVTLYLRCGNIQQAEAVCTRTLQLFSRYDGSSETDMELNLLTLEQDLVAMILQAHIHRLAGDERSETDMLDRCLNVIYNYKLRHNAEDMKMKTDMEDYEGKMLELLDLVAAKLHVQKANNYHKKGFGHETDAIHEVWEAVYCNPDDEDALYLCKMLLKESEVEMPEKETSQRRLLCISDIESISLKYILQTQVFTDNAMVVEEKDHLFQDSDVDIFDEWSV